MNNPETTMAIWRQCPSHRGMEGRQIDLHRTSLRTSALFYCPSKTRFDTPDVRVNTCYVFSIALKSSQCSGNSRRCPSRYGAEDYSCGKSKNVLKSSLRTHCLTLFAVRLTLNIVCSIHLVSSILIV